MFSYDFAGSPLCCECCSVMLEPKLYIVIKYEWSTKASFIWIKRTRNAVYRTQYSCGVISSQCLYRDTADIHTQTRTHHNLLINRMSILIDDPFCVCEITNAIGKQCWLNRSVCTNASAGHFELMDMLIYIKYAALRPDISRSVI